MAPSGASSERKLIVPPQARPVLFAVLCALLVVYEARSVVCRLGQDHPVQVLVRVHLSNPAPRPGPVRPSPQARWWSSQGVGGRAQGWPRPGGCTPPSPGRTGPGGGAVGPVTPRPGAGPATTAGPPAPPALLPRSSVRSPIRW